MTFRMEWIDGHHILSTTFDSHVSVSDLNLVMLEYLGAAQEHEMYFLLDFSNVSPPNEMLSIPSLLQVINHANTRYLGIVIAEASSSYMTKLLTRDKVKIFRTRKAGLNFLSAMIQTDQQLEVAKSS